MTITDEQVCVICKNEIKAGPNDPNAYGHNAEPIARGKCCDSCHAEVLVERFREGIGRVN